jgi:hypothetical protein
MYAAGRDVTRAAVGGARERTLEETTHERLEPRFDPLRSFVGLVRERARGWASLARCPLPSVVHRPGQRSSLAFEQSLTEHWHW